MEYFQIRKQSQNICNEGNWKCCIVALNARRRSYMLDSVRCQSSLDELRDVYQRWKIKS